MKISLSETALWAGNFILIVGLAYFLLEPLSAASVTSPIDISSNESVITLMIRFAIPAILFLGFSIAALWRTLKT